MKMSEISFNIRYPANNADVVVQKLNLSLNWLAFAYEARYIPSPVKGGVLLVRKIAHGSVRASAIRLEYDTLRIRCTYDTLALCSLLRPLLRRWFFPMLIKGK